MDGDEQRRLQQMQSEMAVAKWPSSVGFYSVRLFLVIQVENDRPAIADVAVAWFADIIARPEFTEDEVCARHWPMLRFPRDSAGRVIMFTQVACGTQIPRRTW